MKSNTTFIFAGIMSAIIGNAYATGENIVTSKSYVDNALEQKQDNIPARATKIKDRDQSFAPSVVTNGTTDGDVGQMAIITSSRMQDDGDYHYDMYDGSDALIPTLSAVEEIAQGIMYPKQFNIRTSGYGDANGDPFQYTTNAATNDTSWLNPGIKGTGLVTKSNVRDGFVGERKIFEATDVSGYHATGLTQIEKDIQDISIPTVGAMMSAISNGVSAGLPTGTAGNVVTYDTNGVAGGSVATYDGSGTYTAATDAGKIATAAAIQTREAKMTCAGWPDGTKMYDATHTDANCWLWNKN